MAAFPAFFDTCTLYGGILNDLFLRLAEEGAYRVLWSEQVLLELRRSLAERVGEEPASRRVGAMRRSFPDAAVDGYQHLENRMPVDAGDRHVAAAAVHAGAEVIVTANLRHFPAESLAAFAIQPRHPGRLPPGPARSLSRHRHPLPRRPRRQLRESALDLGPDPGPARTSRPRVRACFPCRPVSDSLWVRCLPVSSASD